jgi:hypothetical protein
VAWACANFRLQPKIDDGGAMLLRQNSATPSRPLCCRRMIWRHFCRAGDLGMFMVGESDKRPPAGKDGV